MRKFKDLLRLSTVRQTAWLLILFSIISAISWGGTFLIVWFEMQRNVDARLTLRMDAAISELVQGEDLPVPGPGETVEIVQTEQPDGFITRDVGRENDETRFLLRTTPHGQILLSEDVERQEELREILAGGMQLSLLATLVCTIALGLLITRRWQHRLNELSNGLARVARGVLDEPIKIEGDDDLALLARRINRTVEQLRDAMTQMRVQSSNIAHDLRTPLARLRGHLETNLIEAVEANKSVAPDVLEDALEHIDQITGTFEALLRLARIESGAGKDEFQQVDLRSLIEETATTYGPVVEEAGQTLEIQISDPAMVRGDRSMLMQLIANLIQNALRYGGKEQTITIQLYGNRLTLTDQGPGIPFDERDKVLTPLYQAEQTRQNAGFGLGLSLVNAIVGLHDATLSLSDGPNGTGLSVSVEFPKKRPL